MALIEVSMPKGAIETLGDGLGFVALVDQMNQDPALKVVNAARISYDKQRDQFEEKDQKLCSFLWNHGHTSPYRHSFFTFHWKAPLFVFRQAFKYQVGSGWRTYEIDGAEVSLEVFDVMFDTDKGCSWNEVSGRYVKWTPEFYVPTVMRANPSHGNKQASEDLPDDFDHAGERDLMLAECKDAFQRYEDRIERGVAKEIARTCLPQNLYTQAYWTVSLQGVLHFLDQRLKRDAQHEIRWFAEGIAELVKPTLDRLGVDLESMR
ncbi:MAG: FAD-dependent thymidylate synthase [Planctomycetota bacterium]|nr:FAD-dependent thymidylate synthase [Planctomycetota bacterium]